MLRTRLGNLNGHSPAVFVQECLLWFAFLIGLLGGLEYLSSTLRGLTDRVGYVDIGERLQGAVIFGALVQVFPIHDLYHLWWASIPAVGPVLARLESHTGISDRKIQPMIRMVAIALIVFLAGCVASKATSEYFEAPKSTIISGSKLSRVQSERIVPPILLMSAVQDAVGALPAINLCADGLYIGIGQKLDLRSPFFIDWGSKFSTNLNEINVQELLLVDNAIVIFCPKQSPYPPNNLKVLGDSLDRFGYLLIEPKFCHQKNEPARGRDSNLVLGVSSTVFSEVERLVSSNLQPCIEVTTPNIS